MRLGPLKELCQLDRVYRLWVSLLAERCRLLAHTGPSAMSELCPLLGEHQTSQFEAVMAAFDPGCVKTSTHGERAELFSLFSSLGGACQSGSLLIQYYRDKRSTRKFDVGVFTQPGPGADIEPRLN